MKRWFVPNLSRRGRLVRGLGAAGLFAGAAFGFRVSPWLAVVFVLLGAFVLFEALRGWCALRACGLKTRL